MGHAHAHAHTEGEGTFFLDQLFTILASGAVGLVAILMYQTGVLGRILVPMFFPWVLAGGVAILLMACVRAVAVWRLAGARRANAAHAADYGEGHGHSHGHDHAHSHGEACGHDHAHDPACEHELTHSHAHSHATEEDDHGHDHGWAPWRYMVIAIPVFLYFLGMPREGYSELSLERQRYKGSLVNPERQALSMFVGGPALTKILKKDQPRVLQLGFKELSEAAAMPVRHDAYEGDVGVIRGEFAPIPGSDREFTLVRWNMTCCRADAIALETRIIAPDPVRIDGRPWVQVTGVISFEKTDRGKWIPVLTVRSNDDIVGTEPTQDANAF